MNKVKPRIDRVKSQGIYLMPLIVLEGGDGVGKSIQCRLLVETLQSIYGENLVHAHRYPGTVLKIKFRFFFVFLDRSTSAGKLITQFLSQDNSVEQSEGKEEKEGAKETIGLLFAANMYEGVGKLKEWLANGHYVIQDRYVPSHVAYSAARGLPFDYTLPLFSAMPKAELTIWLKANDIRKVMGRIVKAERFDTLEFQEKIAKYMAQLFDEQSWYIVDNAEDKSIKQVNQEIMEALNKRLQA